jgi:hypothetical protein
MATQTPAGEMDALGQTEYVKEVKESHERGVSYVLMCEHHNVQRVRVAMLKSDKWTPRDSYRNDESPEHSYVKVTYHADYFA